ncbi:hypothetical protein BG74_08730 [Sodalis-like endosymbiont of Proechinophthirus fluctus]|uniref:hypothetical protein n=1 Tax=Sodalis-like endosymbiont of Proechinophthirus fluctus TaxID=1462730 RepID=UPI0007A8F643|nr:hypothetical protein [Sodalis-like endosymbiont of Proechinophthirus fluctus]KYP95401.1 hypothetical protein BG74_08730 [Sodalis-like endosymbiont of Proechinophthirus fluctus]
MELTAAKDFNKFIVVFICSAQISVNLRLVSALSGKSWAVKVFLVYLTQRKSLLSVISGAVIGRLRRTSGKSPTNTLIALWRQDIKPHIPPAFAISSATH